MSLKKVYGTQNVLEAARLRIKNVFSNGVPVYMSFSCGKDSLCMAHITYSLILSGEIDAKQLTVIFIDEEGLYKSMLEAAYRWREKFLRVGSKKDVWMCEPPPFAIRSHPLVPYAGACNYQTFCIKLTRNGISMIGLRASESIQRAKALAAIKNEINRVYPIYDWKDNDIWLYIKENNLEFPEIYIRLYESGVSKARLRLCSFFGDTTVVGLKNIPETDPELWEKIEKRYPNAYLVLLYYDSEMFKRNTRTRKQLEKNQSYFNGKAKLYDLLFFNTDKYLIPPDTKKTLKDWRRMIFQYGEYMTPKLYNECYEAIL